MTQKAVGFEAESKHSYLPSIDALEYCDDLDIGPEPQVSFLVKYQWVLAWSTWPAQDQPHGGGEMVEKIVQVR